MTHKLIEYNSELALKICKIFLTTKNRRKSAGLSYAVRQTQVLQKGYHTNPIIRQQAFDRLVPVLSLLRLISQTQPKNLQSSIYKRFIMIN